MNASGDKHRGVHGGIRSLALNVVTAVITVVLAVALLFSTHGINVESDALQQTCDRYVACEMAVNDLMETSTYLTTQSRLFSTTQHVTYLHNYYWEMAQNQRREADVEVLRENLPESDATEYIEAALEFSERLSRNELYSMKLVVKALDLDVEEDIAAVLDAIDFTRGDDQLTNAEMLEKAHMLVTYEPYEHDVDRVAQQVEHCKDALAESLESDNQQHKAKLDELFLRQQVLTIVLLALVLFTAITFLVAVFRPLSESIDRINRGELLEEKGANELRFLARSYNDMYEDNRAVRERLTFEAEHDALTGLYNRGACERIISERRKEPMAMVIIDIDHFKEVNDQYGHNVGDLVLKEVSGALAECFPPDGTPFRLGGDEFVVLLFGASEELRGTIEANVRLIAGKLQHAHDGLPSIGVSAGVAFGDGTQVAGELYKLADKALYRVKGEGRHGIAYAGEDAIVPFGE